MAKKIKKKKHIRKRNTKKAVVNKKEFNDELDKKIDSLVEEIERTNNYEKFDSDDILALKLFDSEITRVKKNADNYENDEDIESVNIEIKDKDDDILDKKGLKEINNDETRSTDKDINEELDEIKAKIKEKEENEDKDITEEQKVKELKQTFEEILKREEEKKKADEEKHENDLKKLEEQKKELKKLNELKEEKLKEEKKDDLAEKINNDIEEKKDDLKTSEEIEEEQKKEIKIEEKDNIKEEQKEKLDSTKEKDLSDSQTLFKTNVQEFKFDEERLTQIESLDTSFLEGRINNNAKKKITNKKPKEKIKIRKSFYIILGIIVLIIVGVCAASLLQVNNIKKDKAEKNTKKEVVTKNKEEKNIKIVDDNYLFVGDSFTLDYDIDESYENMPVVSSGEKDIGTKFLLDNLRKYIYQYNPSKIFIQLGVYDILKEENKDMVTNIDSIIKEIKEHRPYAQIYIESIYPVNKSDDIEDKADELEDLDNENIEKINEEIKKVCKKNKIKYIDIYNVLCDKESKELNKEYTNDGFKLTEEGYKKITEKIEEYLLV